MIINGPIFSRAHAVAVLARVGLLAAGTFTPLCARIVKLARGLCCGASQVSAGRSGVLQLQILVGWVLPLACNSALPVPVHEMPTNKCSHKCPPCAAALTLPKAHGQCACTNPCSFIRTPAFWANYSTTNAPAVLALLNATTDFFNTSVAEASDILSDSSTAVAQRHRMVLAAELNAVWNGEPANAQVDGQFGSDVWTAPSSLQGAAIDQANHIAFLLFPTPSGGGPDVVSYLSYVSGGAEGTSCAQCIIVCRGSQSPTPTRTAARSHSASTSASIVPLPSGSPTSLLQTFLVSATTTFVCPCLATTLPA